MLKLTYLGALALAVGASLAAQSLPTTFLGNNATVVGGGVHFDVTVLNPAGLEFTQFDVNSNSAALTPGSIEIYVTARGGTHVGNQRTTAPWTQVGAAPVVAAGPDLPTVGVLTAPFRLGPGTYGMTICYTGIAPRYTNGTGLNQNYANADLQLALGTSQATCFVTGVFTPRVANLEAFYNVSTGTHAVFSATPTSGPAPLTVNFTDDSFTSDPGGIVAWLWDFDNNGTVDSTVQNPIHTYTVGCLDYTVNLTAISAAGQGIVTRTNLIQLDPLRIDWAAAPDSGLAPLGVTFNDFTVPVPLSWAWDFDSDGVVDSTLQNPSFTFGAGCYDTNLTVQTCRGPASLTKRIFATDNVSSGFAGGTFLTALGGTVYMDLQVLNPAGIEICGFDVKVNNPEGTPFTIDVYLTPGSYVGQELQNTLWRRVATGPVVAGATGGPSRARTSSFFLLPGSYGLGLHHIGANAQYTSNTSLTAGNLDLQLSNGAAQAAPIFAGTVLTPRMWNGTIHYTLCSQASRASYAFFGFGCPGTVGIARLEPVAGSRPRLGATFTATVSNMPAVSAGIMLIGLSNTSSIFGPLPVDLTFLGMPGCSARVSTDSSVFLVGAGGSANWSVSLPNNPSLACLLFFNQMLVLDPGVNAVGAVLSDASVGILGQR